jgi:hypothetical protein
MIIQDFNSFFEKLSGLDDVRWNDESHGSAAGTGDAGRGQPAPQAPEAKSPEIKASASNAAAPKPAAPQSHPGPAPRPAATATAPAHLAPAAPGTKPEPHRAAAASIAKAPRKPGMPLPFKLAMTALVLFTVGMGAGWMALSLPKTTDRSRLPENPLIPLDSAAKAESIGKPAPLANPWDAPKPAAPARAAPVAAAATSTTGGKSETIAPVEPTAPQAPELAATNATHDAPIGAGKDEPDAFSQKESDAVPKAPAPQAVTVDLPKSDIFASAKAAVEGAKKAAPKAKSAPQATPPGLGAAQSSAPAGNPQYAVQVGACSSTQCVENYRKLVQPLVGTHPVEVLQQTAGNGSAVQRVRIVPLSKEQAVRLKQSLEQADPRLKHAYVVKVPDRS